MMDEMVIPFWFPLDQDSIACHDVRGFLCVVLGGPSTLCFFQFHLLDGESRTHANQYSL